jgi:hypothetical protein
VRASVPSAVLLALVLAHLAGAPRAFAANFPLELTNIKDGMSPSNRVSRAYPGVEYNIRAAVVGGAYPFVFSLTNQPPGMTIDAATGEIRWPDPKASASPTIVVVDAEGARVSATWTINVSTTGFRFVDGTAGKNAEGNGCTSACGTGAADRPWRSLSDVFRSRAAGEFVYFKTGTYVVTDIQRSSVGTPWERVEFSERQHPVVWMAYPGQKPVIDFSYREGKEVGPIIRLQGPNVYIDGFEGKNIRVIGFQYISARGTGATFRRLKMHTLGPGIDGTNAAFIMTTTSPEPSDGSVIQDCEFSNVTGEAVTLKIYAQRKLLIENTIHHHSTIGIELKDDIRQFSVRGNTIYDVERAGVGGNMHEKSTHGEILFNNIRAGVAVDLNQDGMAGAIHVYRNTLVGRVQVRNADATNGPFYFRHNIIVSDERGAGSSRISHYEVKDASKIVAADNVAEGSSRKVVDANGNLTTPFAKYRGTHGHQTKP